MAFTRKHASGKWQGRYRSPDGKLRSAGTFSRKSDAQRAAQAAQDSIRSGMWIDPDRKHIAFTEFADTIIDARPLHTRPNTYQRDAIHYKHIVARFGSCSLGEIEHADVQKWVTEMSGHFAPNTVIGCFGLFRVILKKAVAQKYIRTNPCEGITLPRVEQKEKRFLDYAQIETLADAMDERYRAMVYVGCYLGLRWGEIAGLQRRHVNILKQQLTVAGSLERVGHLSRFAEPKSKAARRVIGIPAPLVGILEDHLANCGGDYLFTSPSGDLLNYHNWLRRSWHPAVRAAGLWPLTPHEMRHTALALAVDQGADLLEAQYRMGHTDVDTTYGTYGHMFPRNHDRLTQRLGDALQLARGSHTAREGAKPVQL